MKKKSASTAAVLILLAAAWLLQGGNRETRPTAAPRDGAGSAPAVVLPKTTTGYAPRTAPAGGARQSGPYEVTGVSIVDINTGKTLPIRTVDLKPALDRIARGEKHSHRNDGTVFRNAERKLPAKPSGHYREYVVPTDGVRGPGPQRLILGKDGEVYYTFDHYETFIRMAAGWKE